MKDIEFRVERGPVAQNEPFAIGMAKLLEREGKTVAAAELRRLHAENEAMRNVANRGGHIAVAMSRIADLESQRDALLEALRAFESCALPVSRNIDERGHSWTEAYLDQALPIARAAIKAVEETK